MARTTKWGSSSGDTTRMSASHDQMNDMIRKKAFELYEKRGKKHGHAMEDWLEAERIIKRRAF